MLTLSPTAANARCSQVVGPPLLKLALVASGEARSVEQTDSVDERQSPFPWSKQPHSGTSDACSGGEGGEGGAGSGTEDESNPYATSSFGLRGQG